MSTVRAYQILGRWHFQRTFDQWNWAFEHASKSRPNARFSGGVSWGQSWGKMLEVAKNLRQHSQKQRFSISRPPSGVGRGGWYCGACPPPSSKKRNFFLRNEIMLKNSKPAPLRQKILATPLRPPSLIFHLLKNLRAGRAASAGGQRNFSFFRSGYCRFLNKFFAY